MGFQISPLPVSDFAFLFGMDDAGLARNNACRVRATAKSGFPCRTSLEDAEPGEDLILVHHISHDVATPYRSAYAIYVRENGVQGRIWKDELPPVFLGRPIALRAFDKAGMLKNAKLALPGEMEAKIEELFDDGNIAYIHAHNAAHGCFAARIDRY